MLCIAARAGSGGFHQVFDIRLPDSSLRKLQTVECGKVGKILAISGLYKGLCTRTAATQDVGCFRTDLKTAEADAGADASQNIARRGPGIEHAPNGMCSHPIHCAAPACMDGCNKPCCRIGQQDGRAVGYAYGDRIPIAA